MKTTEERWKKAARPIEKGKKENHPQIGRNHKLTGGKISVEKAGKKRKFS